MDGKKNRFSANNAIDLDMSTASAAEADSNGTTWLRISLGEINCVKRVKRLRKSRIVREKFTCSAETKICVCQGDYCGKVLMTVYIEGKTPRNLPLVPDCRYGNRVNLERTDGGKTGEVFELVIIGTSVDVNNTENFTTLPATLTSAPEGLPMKLLSIFDFNLYV